MACTIKTNHHRRELLGAYDLSLSELQEFDYLVDDPKSEEEWLNSGAQFFRFRGELYDLSQFCRIIAPDAPRMHPMECAAPELQGWHGYTSDSMSTGMLIRWGDNSGETVIVGSYHFHS